MKKLLMACFVFGMMTACSTDEVRDTKEMEFKSSFFDENLVFTTIFKGDQFANIVGNEARQYVINTVSEWQLFIAKIDDNTWNNSQFANKLSQATIDFDEEVVVVVSKQLYSGGTNIDIISVVDLGAKIEVNFDYSGEGKIVTWGLTRPYHIVKFAKKNKPIVFNFLGGIKNVLLLESDNIL